MVDPLQDTRMAVIHGLFHSHWSMGHAYLPGLSDCKDQ
jgi:hypothetical protein